MTSVKEINHKNWLEHTQNSQQTQHITQARCKSPKTTQPSKCWHFSHFFFWERFRSTCERPRRGAERKIYTFALKHVLQFGRRTNREFSNFIRTLSIENYIAAKRRKNYTNCRHDCLFRQLMGVWYSRRVCLTPQLSQSLNIHKNHTPASECVRGSWKLMTFEFDLVDREGGKEKEMEFTYLLIFRLFSLFWRVRMSIGK